MNNMFNKTIEQNNTNFDYSLFSIYVDYEVLFNVKKFLFKKIIIPNFNKYNILNLLILIKNKYPDCNINIMIEKSVFNQYKKSLLFDNFEFSYKIYKNEIELKTILFIYKPAYYFTTYKKINIYPKSILIDKLFDEKEFLNNL